MDWDPRQYEKFRAAREQPFDDLAALLDAGGVRRVIDLGCGPGNLTRKLAERLPEAEVIGLDSSAAMLADAAQHAGPRLSFVAATIETFADGGAVDGEFDLIFSNAALHWVPEHGEVLPKLIARLRPRGQIAAQLPADDYNPARVIFADAAGWRHRMSTLDITAYAELLYASGMEALNVFEKVYPHILPDADGVLEWAKGTALLPYLARLPPAQHAPYLEEVRRRLHTCYPTRPVFFPFRRVIFYGRRAYNEDGGSMGKYKGKVVRSDLEGGFWTLEGEDGTTYKLEGGGADLLKSGVRAEVEGKVEQAMGIGFGAPVLAVKKYKIL
jgi:trans-aconitate 2-methyltransferase